MARSYDMILAGFGGQGVLFAGKLIAYAGLLDQREVSWLPSYGPEMRGGTANCSVCLSDEPVGSPLVLAPDVLVALNQPSFDKFVDTIVDQGLAIVDTAMVQVPEDAPSHVTYFEIPASKVAEEEGLKGLANVLCVGKLFAETHFCEEASLYEAVRKCVSARKQDMIDKNIEALKRGMQL